MRLLPLLLGLACHPPYPETGFVPEGDTDADADADADGDVDNPPEQLCSEPWGVIETTLAAEADEDVRWVSPGVETFLMFPVTGQADLCAYSCTGSWLQDEYYITDSSIYETQVELPLRIDEDDEHWAFVHTDPPEDEPDADEYCSLETSAGTWWLTLQLRGSD